MIGTSACKAIEGFGGFNFSEYNIQRHRPTQFSNDYNEQDHLHKSFAGRNPLNPPKATQSQKLGKGANANFDWRERTLALPVPGQVAGSFGRLPFGSASTSLLQWKLHHGLGQNDPHLVHMLSEHDVAPKLRASWQWQSDPYLHSDIGVPSAVNQNMIETPSQNMFSKKLRLLSRGRHDHTNLLHQTRPIIDNDSNVSTGTHHTSGAPPHPVTNGFRATRGPLERPLLLSDLPQPPQPI